MFIELNPDGGPHRHVVTLTIPDDAWVPCDNQSRLTARIAINWVGFHLTAIEVFFDTHSGRQMPMDPTDEEEFSSLHAAFHADGQYETIKIDGRDYVVFGDPDC